MDSANFNISHAYLSVMSLNALIYFKDLTML